MSGAKIKLNTAPVVVGEFNGDTNGNALVTLPLVTEQAGYARPLSEVDAGRVTGSAYLLSGEVSEEYRLRTEIDSILDSDTFNHTAQATGKYTYYNTTMTNTWSGNSMNTNGAGITTINTGTRFVTQQVFSIFGAAETMAYFSIAFTGTWAVTNKTQDIGLFNSPLSIPYAPTDGAYLRANSSGLFGVANFNGAEQTTAVFKIASGGADFVPVIGTFYDCIIETGRTNVVFWMDLQDGEGMTKMASLSSATGSGIVSSGQTAPFAVRDAIGGTVAGGVAGLKLSHYTITQGGFANTRSEITTAAIITGGQQGQQGHTPQGTTALYANNTNATAGAPMSNTGASLGVGLGGQFSAQPTLIVGTDGIVCSYQNPVATTAISGKQLVITGVKVDGIVTTVLANTGPVIYVMCLNYGHTAVSLATAEAATTKARRVIPIGTMSFGINAAAGTTSSTGYFTFTRPIPVNPGEFVSISAKNLGTVSTSGVVTFVVGYDYGWII